MATRKTNSPEIKLSSAENETGTPIPVLSFGANVTAQNGLTAEEFHIKNPNATTTGASPELDFVGYYDASHKLVFVLDKTMDERTPNTLLIINHDPDDATRKWDDILANDYNLDVNTIRPKRDNKYQKLDIEYGGLSTYNNVINAHNAGDDLTNALLGLSIFRDSVARRTAGDRLVAAEHRIGAAGATIKQTTESIQKLKDRQVVLREKLSKQKKSIGREPTKESAAKILKTESQIDDTREKLKRANKRLRRAESRLDASRADADDARKRLGMATLNLDAVETPIIGTRPKITELTTPAPVALTEPEIFTQEDEEPKVEDMAEENVNPLFDKDPDIMNEEIAFKPITFDMPSAKPEPESAPEFVPPVYNAPEPVAPEKSEPSEPLFGAIPIPTSFVTEPEPVAPEKPMFSESEFIPNNIPATTIPASTDVVPVTPVAEPVVAPGHPAPEFIPTPPPAQVATPVSRPASPSGGPVVTTERKRPSGIYYLLLIVLIALSIFTLWLYQKRAGDTTPNITEPVTTQTVETDTLANPFLGDTETPSEPEMPAPVEWTAPEPEPTYAPEPEPIQQPDETYIPEPVGQIVTPVYNQPVAQPQIPTEEEILSRKPTYNIPDSEMPGGVYYTEEPPQPYYDDEVVVVSGQVINEPDVAPAGQVYFNYERREFEPVLPTGANQVITHGVDVSNLGEPDEFHETYDSYETYEEYNESINGDDTDYNYYY